MCPTASAGKLIGISASEVMTDNGPTNLLLRYLRDIDGKLDRLQAGVNDLISRLTVNSRLDRFEARLDRVERRLGLRKASSLPRLDEALHRRPCHRNPRGWHGGADLGSPRPSTAHLISKADDNCHSERTRKMPRIVSGLFGGTSNKNPRGVSHVRGKQRNSHSHH